MNQSKTNYTWKQGFVLQDQGVEVIGKGFYKLKNRFRETFHRKLPWGEEWRENSVGQE